MRPLTWALKGVDRVSQAYMLRNAFKFKIAPHKQKSIVKKKFGRKMGPLANGASLSTPKHNGKSGTGDKS